MKIAIIGTRDPDHPQQQLAAWAAEHFSKAGHDISTGAADGIDSVAMKHCAPEMRSPVVPLPCTLETTALSRAAAW